jgi:hypothetical protein
VKHLDKKTGLPFYFNKELNKKEWELPSSPAPVQPMVPASASTSTPLPPGWEELREPSGRVYYGNRALNIVQYVRPVNLPPGWEELKEPSGRIYFGNPALNAVQYELPMLYKMDGETFSSTNALLNEVYSRCPTGTRVCDVAIAPAAQATPSAAGGAKNKKRRTKRRRHCRKASRRSTSKK